MSVAIRWPEGKSFAFTIFDDPDGQTLAVGREVYALLDDLGFRTTKGVWPIWGNQRRTDNGLSCDEPDYRDWCLSLQERGFEIGYHNATQYTSDRATTIRGLDRFRELFGHDPVTMSNHYNCAEGIYWAEHRVTGVNRVLYTAFTRGRNRNTSFGHVPGHPYFWGDLCRERVTYVRNFVYSEINTLRACPYMPYHDPDRPLVNSWYASSEGANVDKLVAMLSEANQDALAEQGGACIMYTHFGHGYVRGGKLDPRFRALMTRLSRMNGWYVPASTLLGHLRAQRGDRVITAAQRAELERRWLWDKARRGTS
jgi:hypothetical protein